MLEPVFSRGSAAKKREMSSAILATQVLPALVTHTTVLSAKLEPPNAVNPAARRSATDSVHLSFFGCSAIFR